ncbi:sterol desaturase family protein [Humitalea sp. 24SJ18S-53]|uniref:sterol desaturase family protein n=1 Tax=Humitalea sp. 24SJ18S-53 TaxID=3422307 RepID=UPI003D6685C0
MAAAFLLSATGSVLLLGFTLLPDWRAAGASAMDGLLGELPFGLSGEAAFVLALNKAMLLCLAVLPVMLLETALCGWHRSSFARLLPGRSTSAGYDLLIFALHLMGLWKFLVAACTLGGMVLVSALTAQLVADFTAQGLRIRTGSVPVDIALAFVLFTFADYWSHRFFHTRTFWPLHRIHHSATEMTSLTLWRNHPVAPAIEAFFKVWPFALFDVPALAVTLIGFALLAYLHLIHSNIGWHWGWFGRWILIPPAGHWIHHAHDAELHGRNLGIPVIWDRLFGTFADPRLASGVHRLGVSDAASNTGRPHAEVWHDLVEWLGGLWRLLPRFDRRKEASGSD